MTATTPILSFTGQPLVEVFDTPAAAAFFVQSLSRVSRSSDEHSALPLWAALPIAEDEEGYMCVVYSPQVLGRVLDKTNTEDYTTAFFHFLDNPPYDWVWADAREGKVDTIVENFGQRHHWYCTVGIPDLFAQWQSQKQKVELLGHVALDGAARAKPKL